VSTLRSATVHVEFGLVDGWLVGGPSPEPSDVNVRRMSVHVTVPFDGSPGDAELVLYEAMGLGAYRERWVVRADADNLSATQALPEVRAMLSAVIAKLALASPDLVALLDIVGLVRDGGLEAAGLDRLLFEPELVGAQVRTRGLELATTLRRLVNDVAGSASTMTWSVGNSTLSLDAVDRTFGVSISNAFGDVIPCAISASLGIGNAATFDVSIGELDASAGGVRLVGRAGSVTGLAVEWKGAGTAPTRTMALLPVPDIAAFTRFAATIAPAFLFQGLARALRDRASAAGATAIDAALDALSLLREIDAEGNRAIRLPIALFDDASAWLRHGAESWRTDAVGSMVRLLDAVAPIVAPARGAAAGWPIVPGVAVTYTGAGGRLSFTLDATLTSTVGAASVATRINGGIRISSDGRVEPSLEASVLVDGAGLQLSVTPSVQLALVRRAPAPLLML
jgi:hypothetical protein